MFEFLCGDLDPVHIGIVAAVAYSMLRHGPYQAIMMARELKRLKEDIDIERTLKQEALEELSEMSSMMNEYLDITNATQPNRDHPTF